MSDDENQLVEQLKRDNEHFKGLLDLIPPQSYFSQEQKDEIWGNTVDSDDGEAIFCQKKKKHGKKRVQVGNSLAFMTISQIAEMRQKGETIGDANKKKQKTANSTETEEDSGIESIAAKHKGKKQSRPLKSKKADELQRREAWLKERLRVKLQEIKSGKNTGKGFSSQEQKRLKRQEKKVNAKLKNKNNSHKEERHTLQVANGRKSPQHNETLNDNDEPVKSKFDLSIISFGNEKSRSDLHGLDYNRLLEKVEKRKEKVARLKEKDIEAGNKLESKIQWQAVLSKALGEKVKDDATLLKRAAKKMEKVKERKQKKWGDHMQTVEDKQKRRQDKRQTNIDKRKSDKMDKKRKKVVKKGRIIPGF